MFLGLDLDEPRTTITICQHILLLPKSTPLSAAVGVVHHPQNAIPPFHMIHDACYTLSMPNDGQSIILAVFEAAMVVGWEWYRAVSSIKP